ncbi:hypothetical protein DY000_02059006 [Brassica cretica]|uniref:Uncharacterized protein n=1 Tax=Brassica cretica TaxID=69181 RepID=A0ABQ7AZF3_BRACR|nr:hypothetical protein DY000_02059006 [Brassica cretica]
MHPPELNLMETENGSCSRGTSYTVKGRKSVTTAARVTRYNPNLHDYNDRIGRTVDISGIRGADGLKDKILREYGLLGREIFDEMSYWLDDDESDIVGKGAAPVQIATDTDYKIFKALQRADKSVNVFVTFREFVGGERIFLRYGEALGAAYAGDSGTTKPVYEKSTDNQKIGESVEVGSVVIPGSDNLPHQTCNERDKEMSSGDAMVVDMGKIKEDNACVACVGVVEEKGNSKEVDIEETCQEIVVDRGKSKGDATEAGFGVMELTRKKVREMTLEKMKMMISNMTSIGGMIMFEMIV